MKNYFGEKIFGELKFGHIDKYIWKSNNIQYW